MAQYFIVNTEDATVTKTDDFAVADNYQSDDRYVVIDANRSMSMYEGMDMAIPDDAYDPDLDAVENPDPEDEGVED